MATASRHDRTLDHIQTDVGFANTYRLEAIKHLMSISAGLFVFSIAFMKDIVGEPGTAALKPLLVGSWLALSVSLIMGVFHMKCWDRYYIAYRKSPEESRRRRDWINPIRVAIETLQIGSFAVGVVSMLAFSAANL